MEMIVFLINSILLGVALAIDAFSVSIANGISEPNMSKAKMIKIALVFGIFQALMPFVGWILIHSLIDTFNVINKFVPYIALILLTYLGIKMIYDGISNKSEAKPAINNKELFIEGVATSIDALSVGLTIANYSLLKATIESTIIGLVTTIVCFVGLLIAKKIHNKVERYATVIGGVVLILIGIEIFITGVF